jgi:hypothetical protein
MKKQILLSVLLLLVLFGGAYAAGINSSPGITGPTGGGSSNPPSGCVTTGASILKGNGSGGCANAVGGTDYQSPIVPNGVPNSPQKYATNISSAGLLSGKQVACTDLSGATAHCGSNASEITAGQLGTAFGGAGSLTGILKAVAGVVSTAVSGVDFQAPIAGNTLPANNFATSINGAGTISGSRPSCGSLSDSKASCNTDTTNANNIIAGVLPVPQTQGVSVSLANSASGTAPNNLVTITSSNQAQTLAVGATQGLQGICIGGCTNTGSATIQILGIALCQFTGGVTSGDYAQVDGSVAGNCVDGGSSYPTSGGEVVGTVWSPTTAGPGVYNVLLLGPDVASTGGGGGVGGINSPVEAGNETYYASTAKTLSPVAHTIHMNPSATEPLRTAINACGTNSCIIIGDPGQTYNINGPTVLGGTDANVLTQTLVLNGAQLNCTDTTAGNKDDCLIISSGGRLYCTANKAGFPTGINAAGSSTVLNAVITDMGGVITDVWQASPHTYIPGQFIWDATSGTTQQVSSITGSGTSGSSLPSFNTTVGNTTVDNQVTWKTLLNGGGNGSHIGFGPGKQFWINDCRIAGNTGASINSILHVSGLNGGIGTIRNLIFGQLSSSGNSTTKEAGHGTGLLIDDGQINDMCTGAGAPLACCTGSNAGTCQSTPAATNGCCATVYNMFLTPGFPPGGSNGPTYGVHITANKSQTLGIHIDSGQIADISGTNNVAITAVDVQSGGNNVSDVTFQNVYFEIGAGTGTPEGGTDAVLVNKADNIDFLNFVLTNNSTNALTNCFHLQGGAAQTGRLLIQGRIQTGNNCTNAITNDIDHNSDVGGGTGSKNVDWIWAGSSGNIVIDDFNLGGTWFPTNGLSANVISLLKAGNIWVTGTAPTISSGFCTSPTIVANNGTGAFQVNVGTCGATNNGTIGLPTATTGWHCTCQNVSTNGNFIRETASATSSCTMSQYSTGTTAANFASNDKLNCSAFGF